MSCVRLAWLDRRALEHLCPMDDLVGLHGEHHCYQRRHRHCKWHCYPDYRVWTAGCGCERHGGGCYDGEFEHGRCWGEDGESGGGGGGGGCVGVGCCVVAGSGRRDKVLERNGKQQSRDLEAMDALNARIKRSLMKCHCFFLGGI